MSLHIDASRIPLHALRQIENRPLQASNPQQRVPLLRQAYGAAETSVVVAISASNIPLVNALLPVPGMANSGLWSPAGVANDRVAILQTANTALGSVKTRLMQIRDHAAEAANKSSTTVRREVLQLKVQQLASEIDQIGRQTKYNGMHVFDQNTANVPGDPSMQAILGGLKSAWLENAEKTIQKYYGLTADGAPLHIDLTSFTDGPYGAYAQVLASVPFYGGGKGTNLTLQLDRANFLPATLPNGGVPPIYSDRIIAHELTHAVMARTMNYSSLVRQSAWFVEGAAEFLHGGDERLASDLARIGGNPQVIVNAAGGDYLNDSVGYSASYTAVRFLHAQIKSAGGDGIRDVMNYLSSRPGASLDDAFRQAVAPRGGAVGSYTSADAFLRDFKVSGAAFIRSMNLNNLDTGAIGGYDADGGTAKTAESVIADAGQRPANDVLAGFAERFDTMMVFQPISAWFQFNPGMFFTGRTMVGAMNAPALGINALNLIDDPRDAINQADRALRYVNREHAQVASQLNRVDSLFAGLQGLLSTLNGSPAWVTGPENAASLATRIGAGLRANTDAALLAQANIRRPVARQLLQADK